MLALPAFRRIRIQSPNLIRIKIRTFIYKYMNYPNKIHIFHSIFGYWTFNRLYKDSMGWKDTIQNVLYILILSEKERWEEREYTE